MMCHIFASPNEIRVRLRHSSLIDQIGMPRDSQPRHSFRLSHWYLHYDMPRGLSVHAVKLVQRWPWRGQSSFSGAAVAAAAQRLARTCTSLAGWIFKSSLQLHRRVFVTSQHHASSPFPPCLRLARFHTLRRESKKMQLACRFPKKYRHNTHAPMTHLANYQWQLMISTRETHLRLSVRKYIKGHKLISI